MKITFFSAHRYDQDSFERAADSLPSNTPREFVYQEAALDTDTIPLAHDSDAVCVFVNDTLDRQVLEQLHSYGVKAVLLRCAGYNNVDLDTAHQLGMFVARVPAYSPPAVAEHALALAMALNRHIHRAYTRVRDGNFALDGLVGRNLHGKTVGIIGTGRIGLATARIFKGLGCTVIGSDPFPSEEFNDIGTLVELPQLLKTSDVISLHCPLLESTHHLINSDTLAQMKKGALLINTSRGGLIDTHAVIAALKIEQLGGLAIDVYENEEPLFFINREETFIDDDQFVRLMSFPNVLITGHQGFFTEEALHEIAHTTLINLEDFVAGRECENRV
ncbi:2-hydroxyacid dehydrogenase [Carnimonas nigrificans]|uniref:2-hydroxyacid dehydrogenase n=1 Tax=Carnimonas nigrificans TaxID=64323 RepID=UPI0004B9E045|nr:2-hydroxyacid dehydrogenase [Carnimonas nigrificans]